MNKNRVIDATDRLLGKKHPLASFLCLRVKKEKEKCSMPHGRIKGNQVN